MERVEEWPDGDWKVRMVTGASSTKVYRCPGCDQEIRGGLPHLVSLAGLDRRRRRAPPLAHRVLAQETGPRPRPQPLLNRAATACRAATTAPCPDPGTPGHSTTA